MPTRRPRSPRAGARPAFALAATLALALSGCPPQEPAGRAVGAADPQDPRASTWDQIVAKARGQTVTWAMWQGDPTINAYVADWVTPRVRERYGVELKVVPSQGNDIVAKLLVETEAGVARSDYDLMWINGETFYQLRQIQALWGPFTDVLPHAAYIDFRNPFIAQDFQQPIDGYECPWGNVQLALIYDEGRVDDPPSNAAELEAWVRAHPGRFTIDTGFTGLTFLKSLLIDLAGGPGSLDGPFDEAKYARHSERLWTYLNRIRPFLWREGRSFPQRLSQMHQMFAAGELDFTMSNNDGEVDNKILQGLFPPSARAYVLETGTIQNSHYLGITARSGHKEGALVVINFLISPEAQHEKAKPSVWGDGTVLDLDRLPAPWPERFRNLPDRDRAPDREKMSERALKEPAAEYMIRMAEDFRTRVIEP